MTTQEQAMETLTRIVGEFRSKGYPMSDIQYGHLSRFNRHCGLNSRLSLDDLREVVLCMIKDSPDSYLCQAFLVSKGRLRPAWWKQTLLELDEAAMMESVEDRIRRARS